MKKPNAWKKYGALVLAGVLCVGTVSGTGIWKEASVAVAEEEQPVTLNIAEAEEKEAEPLSETVQDEKKETFLNIAGADDAEPAEAVETELLVAEGEPAEEVETEAVTEAPTEEAATEAQQKETFEQIAAVDTSDMSIVTTDVSDIVESCMASIVSLPISQ